MNTRDKKLLFALGFVPFLILYMGAALFLWDQLPDSRLLELVFFIVAGTLWAFPLKPVMQWMNKPAPDADDAA
jgi:hypothetical protein